MREARVQFVCGKNVLASMRGWLMAANIIEKTGNSYTLTDFGGRLVSNDKQLARAGSWWCFHLNVCFSFREEPYRSFFQLLGERGSWLPFDDDLVKKIASILTEYSDFDGALVTIDGNIEGVKRMFIDEGPLTDLGLIETRKDSGKLAIRLSTPVVADQTIIYALALARHRYFRTATTVHFSELIGANFNHFLCMSVNDLRKRLRVISRGQEWSDYMKFIEGKDLDSIELRDKLHPKMTVLQLLQETDDTWV